MSDDDPARGSTPFSSPIQLEYEPSQLHDEIRREREALLSPITLEKQRRARHLQRVRKGYSPPSSPSRTPRSSAKRCQATFSPYYRYGGALNSQTGDQTFVDNLLGFKSESSPVVSPQKPPPEAVFKLEVESPVFSQEAIDETQYTEDDHDLPTQLDLLRSRLIAVVNERDALRDMVSQLNDERDKMQREKEKLTEERDKYKQSVRQWEEAARSSSPLFRLMYPLLNSGG
ncbi:hypothetical protein MIND_00651000 [Mycena indigotica]|uniref:Uncharacterized protein n=1 Tax=Mycena indigotica TaxID=2126181 RepID=A0A8H6SRP6_9AGAR|nr:uncharacterized protein MIND_00651000 [Mycena indigotica]KAF7304189.1 hypothetical protein MIND_00651000 [Mycena indigotica]